jgi:ribulose bisphosphate carboxylase small subunit
MQLNIMEPKQWSNILTNIMKSDEFKNQITHQGYYLSPEYADFRTYLKKEWKLNSAINTANFLSKDFWHDQSRILRENNYYLIRSGRGS